ncbi:MAG: HlyC/CorC family transporter [Pseudomonadota bacterium]
MTLTIAIFAGAILALIILSAFFSGSETALTATSRARMHELERKGVSRAGIVKSLVQTPERFIGAILLGNNLVNILASALATALFVKLFGDAGVVLATFLMTALVLIFAEVLPKTYAISNSDRMALAVAPIIRVCVWLFGPLVRGVEFVVRHTLRLFGVKAGDSSDLTAYDEVRGTIDLQHQEGAFVKDDRDMIGGILDLRELEVFDVMVHRTNMFTINIDDPSEQIIKAVLDSGYTRVPAWKDEQDNIVGILHARDILAAVSQSKGETSKIGIAKLCAAPWFVPDTNSVADQLKAFRRRKSHFALVVDEYGEVQGLVTMEDILEEIVGDIADEHDVEDALGVRREANGAFAVDGTVPIRDLNRAMDWDLPDEEVNTVAGLVIHEAQIIPDSGQVFTFYGFTFEVVERERNQITKLRITPLARRKSRPVAEA